MAEQEAVKEKAEGKPHSGIPEAIFLVSHIYCLHDSVFNYCYFVGLVV